MTYLWKNVSGGNWGTSTDWSPIGVPGAADNATILGTGTYSVVIAAPASVHNLNVGDTNATIDDQASLMLYGTLSLLGEFILESGAILVGGVVNIDVANGGSFLANGGMLDGVKSNGLLELDGANASLHIRDGITLNGIGGCGAGTVNLTGSSSALYIDNTTTLDNATVNIGNDTARAGLVASDTIGTGLVLTLGSHLNVMQTAKYGAIQSNTYYAGSIVGVQWTRSGSRICGGSWASIPLSSRSEAASERN